METSNFLTPLAFPTKWSAQEFRLGSYLFEVIGAGQRPHAQPSPFVCGGCHLSGQELPAALGNARLNPLRSVTIDEGRPVSFTLFGVQIGDVG